jgi:hemolysin III
VDPGDVLGLEHLGSMIKPRLRGWLHAGTFPLAVAVGAVLTALSPDTRSRLALALFTLSAAVISARFGFHEVFHALTIAAFTAHCAGITIALRSG